MIDGAIQRKVCGIGVIVASRAGVIRAGKGTCLVILNEGVDIRIIKSLENSGVLIGGVSEIVKHEIKKQEGGFLGMLLGTLSVSMLKIRWLEKVLKEQEEDIIIWIV